MGVTAYHNNNNDAGDHGIHHPGVHWQAAELPVPVCRPDVRGHPERPRRHQQGAGCRLGANRGVQRVLRAVAGPILWHCHNRGRLRLQGADFCCEDTCCRVRELPPRDGGYLGFDARPAPSQLVHLLSKLNTAVCPCWRPWGTSPRIASSFDFNVHASTPVADSLVGVGAAVCCPRRFHPGSPRYVVLDPRGRLEPTISAACFSPIYLNFKRSIGPGWEPVRSNWIRRASWHHGEAEPASAG